MIITYESYIAKYRHVALFTTQDGDNGTIFQLTGIPGDYKYNEKWAKLSNSRSLDKKYIISRIDIDNSIISRIARSNQIIQDSNSDWNWVSEANTFLPYGLLKEK